MSMQFSFDHFRSTVSDTRIPRPEPEAPFRILVIGDFSGRANRGQLEPLHARKTPKVDIDNLESLMSAWQTRLGFQVGTDGAYAMGFQELEHFHPDQIFQRVELFTALRDLRQRLTDPSTSAAAADEVRRWAGRLPASSIEPKPTEAPATPQSEFEALLGGHAGTAPARSSTTVDAMIRSLIAPHIVPDAAPDLPELIAMVDQTISDQMLSVLREPDFRTLETNWRGLHTLITSLETGEELELCVLDASRAEIEADLNSDAEKGLHEILTSRPRSTPGGHPWSVICLLESFGASAENARLIGQLAICAHASGGVLFAGARDELAGVKSIASTPRPDEWNHPMSDEAAHAWQIVRQLPEAGSIGLALPRVLARLPYGQRTEPVDTFEFEECGPGWEHESLLWSNPAVLCTLLLGRAFAERGWSLDPQAGGDIDGLPVFVPSTDPDRSAVPTAEAWLTDAGARRLLELGLIPMMSVQHRDAVHVPRLCAINAGPLTPAWA